MSAERRSCSEPISFAEIDGAQLLTLRFSANARRWSPALSRTGWRKHGKRAVDERGEEPEVVLAVGERGVDGAAADEAGPIHEVVAQLRLPSDREPLAVFVAAARLSGAAGIDARDERLGRGEVRGREGGGGAVSYTHLTLPTILLV